MLANEFLFQHIAYKRRKECWTIQMEVAKKKSKRNNLYFNLYLFLKKPHWVLKTLGFLSCALKL